MFSPVFAMGCGGWIRINKYVDKLLVRRSCVDGCVWEGVWGRGQGEGHGESHGDKNKMVYFDQHEYGKYEKNNSGGPHAHG
jgi:hypothetical protein